MTDNPEAMLPVTQGDAGDAIDFALGHCGPEEALAFLDDWRADRADEWPGYVKWLSVQYRTRFTTDRASQPEREAVDAVEAFEMGRLWQQMLQGQTLEDSRAIGRTLGSDIFKSIHARLAVAEKEIGFNPFADSDTGIFQAIKIIHAALTTPAPAVKWGPKFAHLADEVEAIISADDATACRCTQAFGLHHNPACPLSGRVTKDNFIPPRGAIPEREAVLVERLRAYCGGKHGGCMQGDPCPVCIARDHIVSLATENARLTERVAALRGGLKAIIERQTSELGPTLGRAVDRETIRRARNTLKDTSNG